MNSKHCIALCLALGLAPTLMAQNAELNIPDFKGLEHKARESVNITIGGWLLHTAGAFIDEKDEDAAATKKLLSGIKSVQVRSFEFDADNAYPTADVDAVRRQLEAPGWSQLVKVRNRNHEDVDIYLFIENDRTRGLAIVASEPREFTIVNIVGSINLEDLPKLQKQLHLPKMSLSPEMPVALALPAQL
jgi:Domain of unknown function (DUF4252)